MFDTHYPVYTPKEGFANATAIMQSADPPVYVVPYVSVSFPRPWQHRHGESICVTASICALATDQWKVVRSPRRELEDR